MRHLIRFTLIALPFFLAGCAATRGTSPKGLEIPIETAALKLSTDVKEGGYKIVSTEELKKWLDEGKKLLVISTLPAEEDRKSGTISAAVNGAMPRSEKEVTPAQVEKLLKAAGSEKDRLVVVYCGYVACRRSHLGAKALVDQGFSNVYRYPAGIVAWTEAGYPLSRK